MITRIQALNYRCLRYVDVALDRFHVLVGANASGKSTLFDAVSFVGDFVRDGLEKAVSRRVYTFRDLVWGRPNRDPGFEIALEVKIPEEMRSGSSDGEGHHTYRYEIAVREDAAVPHVSCERATLIAGPSMRHPECTSSRAPFPQVRQAPDTILAEKDDPDSLMILNRTLEQFSLATEDQKVGDMSGEVPVRALWGTNLIDPLVSHLRFLDKTRFPLSLHVQSLLSAGINAMFLESTKMRRPSLCFATTSEGGTDIIRGDHHPVLADWQTSADLDVLFASMVVE